MDVIDVGQIDWLLTGLLLLPQGIVGRYYILAFNKVCSNVPYAKGPRLHLFGTSLLYLTVHDSTEGIYIVYVGNPSLC